MTKDVGTMLFSAPEMIDNFSNYTDKVDVWSLGCLFYEIFCPDPLFEGINNIYKNFREQFLISTIENYRSLKKSKIC